ncbi:hypothetical protein AL485_15930 [Serratia liquefaciens]|uniref:lysozyme inhibitor LprI family protein n=1 Tax=Serratia liquefaciens TaxID=614 RepID=UPI000CD6AC0D|nr:lysozyme inhibitor LprI family protein [Serratia liquefaciens]AUW40033.1 hypothetical protein AL485_15930 [Serratia liquefaciens]
MPLLLCGPAYAASFNCRLAEQADERAICADPHLSEQDVRLATTYHLLREQLLMGGRGALQDEQQAWLGQRRQCGADRACLQKQYTVRQQALDALYRQHVQPE